MTLRQRLAPCALLVLASLAATPASAQYAAPMRDVENPDRFPFMANASGSLESPFVNGFVQFATPLGRRYVIEQVSLSCTTPSASDQITSVSLSTRLNQGNISIGYSAPVLQMSRRGAAPFGGFVWTGHALVKMVSDPDTFSPDGGKAISLNIFHTESNVTVSCNGFVGGHTVTP